MVINDVPKWRPLSLTKQITVSNGPGLGRVKVRVPADAVAGEVGVRQEAPLTVEGAAVTVETLSEEQHYVCKLLHLVADVAVGDLAEGQRGHAFPHLEGLPDGLVGLVLTHLGGVVLDAAGGWRQVKLNTIKQMCVCVCGVWCLCKGQPTLRLVCDDVLCGILHGESSEWRLLWWYWTHSGSQPAPFEFIS